jgi:hypothetical protein
MVEQVSNPTETRKLTNHQEILFLWVIIFFDNILNRIFFIVSVIFKPFGVHQDYVFQMGDAGFDQLIVVFEIVERDVSSLPSVSRRQKTAYVISESKFF